MTGARQIIEFALPGDVFGLDCHDIHKVHAEAITAAKLVRYPRKSVEMLGEQIPQVGRELASVLRSGWISAQSHMVMLGRQSAKERVATFLVEMVEHQSAANRGSIYLPMGRQDIADYLGLTIETVCRTFSDLKSDHIVSLPDRHHVIIWSRAALDSLVRDDAQISDKDERQF